MSVVAMSPKQFALAFRDEVQGQIVYTHGNTCGPLYPGVPLGSIMREPIVAMLQVIPTEKTTKNPFTKCIHSRSVIWEHERGMQIRYSGQLTLCGFMIGQRAEIEQKW